MNKEVLRNFFNRSLLNFKPCEVGMFLIFKIKIKGLKTVLFQVNQWNTETAVGTIAPSSVWGQLLRRETTNQLSLYKVNMTLLYILILPRYQH